MARTVMMIFDGDVDHEVFQAETDCIPRRGEAVVVDGKRRAVEYVEWHFVEGRLPQAHVYLWAKND
jgi:hypothetical protein